ncbi:MAG: hypothetical protein GF341_11355, partial [candidate division Zixibacteria bacterium]|nr:hypothetical protein [candidate division Zixibacteria bacterium]
MSVVGGWLRRRLRRGLAATARVRPASCPSPPQRILVVRDGGLGDLILTVPIIRTLRQHFGPAVSVDVLVRKQVADVYRDFDQIDKLWTRSSHVGSAFRTIRSMRRRRYDLVVDMVLSPSLSFALWVVRVAPGAHRIGGDKGELVSLYHQHVDLPPRPSLNLLERLRRIGAQAFGDTALVDHTPWIDWPSDVIKHADSVWQGAVEDENDSVVVLINLSAGIPARTWPDDKYQELLGRLIDEYGGRVNRWVITAAPHE